MKKLQIILIMAIVTISAPCGTAQASTINVILGNTSSDLAYSFGSNVIDPNLDLLTLGSGLVLSSNAQIIAPPSTVVNEYIQPSGSLYGNSYLAVKGIPVAGLATFTLAADLNAFAFTWGTIDAYNKLTLTDSRNVNYTITGSDILNLLAGSVAGTTQSDVSFTTSLGLIVKAQLASTNNSFEAGNFSATDPPVPLPPALPLFAAALIVAALVVRRYKTV